MATPSQGYSCLGIESFSDVYISCESVQANWLRLATYLRVYQPTVQAIQSKGLDPAKCLHEVLSAWLKCSSPTQPKPSWKTLCDALSGMGEVALAETIQREHACGYGLCKESQLHKNASEMMDDLNKELIMAVKIGNEESVKTLIDSGANVNIKTADGGKTPLHIATRNGHSEVVKILLSHGATVDIKDAEGHATPLHIASWSGKKDIVNILLSHGAKVDIKDSYAGKTALHMASSNGYSDIVNMLVSHGAKVDDKDNEGKTPLHAAVYNNEDNVAGILLSHGATMNIVDENRQTPLHCCLLNSSYHNITATLKLLISNGADLYQEDKYNQSPILVGTVLGLERLLLQHGVSEDTIAKYRLPQGWSAEYESSGQIKYTNTATGKKQYFHPLIQ